MMCACQERLEHWFNLEKILKIPLWRSGTAHEDVTQQISYQTNRARREKEAFREGSEDVS
jgi:hypothetical protein